jgi:pyruvate dehydrogenase E1 component alpha subunit
MTYRPADEVAKARANADPLQIFRQRVVEASLLKVADFDAIDAETVAEIARCMAKAKAAPLPTEADLMTDVYLNY